MKIDTKNHFKTQINTNWGDLWRPRTLFLASMITTRWRPWRLPPTTRPIAGDRVTGWRPLEPTGFFLFLILLYFFHLDARVSFFFHE